MTITLGHRDWVASMNIPGEDMSDLYLLQG